MQPSTETLHSIQLIQKEYKIMRIKKQLSRFRSLNLTDLKNMNYEQVMIRVLDKNIILDTNKLLLRLTRYIDPTKKSIPKNMCRLLISAYITTYHSKNILTYIEENSKLPLILCAFKLTRLLESTMFQKKSKYCNDYYIMRFGSLFNEYCVQYNLLREFDKKALVDCMIRELLSLRTTMNYVQNGTKYSDIQKKNIMKQLLIEEKKYIQELKMLEPKMTDELLNSAMDVGQRTRVQYNNAIWGMFVEQLKEKNYTMLFEFLEDIKQLLIDLTIEKQKVKKRESLDQTIDVDLIKQMLHYNAMDGEQIIKLCNNIYALVTELQSEIRDDDHYKQYKTLLNNITDNGPSNGPSNGQFIAQFIAQFLQLTFVMIDNIYCDILLLGLHMNGI